MYVQNWQPREMSWWQDGKAKYLQVLAGEGSLEPSDLGHWQKTTAAALARGEIKQSMKLEARVTQWCRQQGLPFARFLSC